MTSYDPLQAIFFDFDGVLIDSLKVKNDAFSTLFADYPEVIEPLLAHHRRYGGISRVEKIAWVYDELLDRPLGEEELTAEAQRYSDLVMDAVVGVPYIAGAKEFLELCSKEHPQLSLFVVSGTPQHELREVTARRDLDRYFVEVLGSPRYKPEIVEEKLAQYSLARENCLFIGDALTDYETAEKTGLHFIGVQGVNQFPEGTLVLPDLRGLSEVVF